jgi:hypothetical protein
MFGDARGGNDSLIATGNINTLIGDALVMADNARGGNDSLAAFGEATLFGDAGQMFGDNCGGNDSLIATGNHNDELFGDARNMHGNAVGGDDRLLAAMGTTVWQAMRRTCRPRPVAGTTVCGVTPWALAPAVWTASCSRARSPATSSSTSGPTRGM